MENKKIDCFGEIEINLREAAVLGIDEAVLLAALRHNQGDFIYKVSKPFTYMSAENLQRFYMNYCSVATIRRSIRKLKKLGILKVEKGLFSPLDRTNIYTINREKIDEKLKNYK